MFLLQQLFVNRDLKPENLLYTTRDHLGVLKLSDFGFAVEVILIIF